MKKILLTALIATFGLTAYSADFASGGNPGFGAVYGDFSGMQNPNSELNLLREHQFRQEEYNEFDDMKQVKAKRNKKIELEQQMNNMQKRQSYPSSNNIEIIRE